MASDAPKNLLVLLWDELQRDTLGCYGGSVPTPACDALASQGIVFDSYYCACPLCVPTRPSIFGGKWPHAHGSVSFGANHSPLNPGEQMLFDRFLDAEYNMAYEGIWHINRRPEDSRRDEWMYFRETGFCREQYREELERAGLEDGIQRAPVTYPTDAGEIIQAELSIPVPMRWTGSIDEHLDMQHALNLAEFIRNAPDDRPFAVFHSSGVPHPPLLVPDRFYDMFDPADVVPPPGFSEDISRMPFALREAPGRQAVVGWEWEKWAPAIAAYLGFVAFGDYCHQIVLDALYETGRADDTLTIMTCDHGEMLGAHGMYQKGCLYEQSIRLPLLISGPGIEAGRRDQLASQTDFTPTILEMLGLPPIEEAQGRSLVDVIRDPSMPTAEYTFSEFNGHMNGGVKMRACISATHKYIYYHDDPIDQLFDLVADPYELNNLAKDPQYAGIKAQMRVALADWMTSTGDFITPQWPSA